MLFLVLNSYQQSQNIRRLFGSKANTNLMEIEDTQIMFSNSNGTAMRVFELLKEMELFHSRESGASRVDLCFQIQNHKLCLYSNHSKWMSPGSSTPFIACFFSHPSCHISNPPNKIVSFGIHIGDLISKIDVIKKHTEELRFVLSKHQVRLYFESKGGKSFVCIPFVRIPQPLVEFGTGVGDLQFVGHLTYSFLEENKQSREILNVVLTQQGMTLTQEVGEMIYSEMQFRSPQYISKYNKEDLSIVLGSRNKVRLFHSLGKHLAFSRKMGFHSAGVRILPPLVRHPKEGLLVLEFENNDIHVIKCLPCHLLEFNDLKKNQALMIPPLNPEEFRMKPLKLPLFQKGDKGLQNQSTNIGIQKGSVNIYDYSSMIKQEEQDKSSIHMSYRLKCLEDILVNPRSGKKSEIETKRDEEKQQQIIDSIFESTEYHDPRAKTIRPPHHLRQPP